jgi:mRNA interferase MazF
MVADEYVPNRGDIVWMSFTPHAGHEQAGHRPAIVISPRGYNEASSFALFCPITTQVKGYPFEVALPTSGSVRGVVLADQVKSLDWRARRARFGYRTNNRVVSQVLALVNTLLE